MSRLNAVAKFILIQANMLFSTVGLALMGIALYMIFANWGNLDPGFFLGSGIAILFFGFILTGVSCLSNRGAMNQDKLTEAVGVWTGRRILATSQIFLIITLIAEGFVLTVSLRAVRDFKMSFSSVAAGQSPPLTSFEQTLAQKFDAFYFGAVVGCTDQTYLWFWAWVNSNCPAEMAQLRCEQCASYSVTSCYADQTHCYANGMESPSCPYMLCREGMLTYFVSHIRPLAYFVLAFTAIQLLIMLCSCMLICYAKRDSLEEILYKTGTISNLDRTQGLPRINTTHASHTQPGHGHSPTTLGPQSSGQELQLANIRYTQV